jgi:hypothetical protein
VGEFVWEMTSGGFCKGALLCARVVPRLEGARWCVPNMGGAEGREERGVGQCAVLGFEPRGGEEGECVCPVLYVCARTGPRRGRAYAATRPGKGAGVCAHAREGGRGHWRATPATINNRGKKTIVYKKPGRRQAFLKRRGLQTSR